MVMIWELPGGGGGGEFIQNTELQEGGLLNEGGA